VALIFLPAASKRSAWLRSERIKLAPIVLPAVTQKELCATRSDHSLDRDEPTFLPVAAHGGSEQGKPQLHALLTVGGVVAVRQVAAGGQAILTSPKQEKLQLESVRQLTVGGVVAVGQVAARWQVQPHDAVVRLQQRGVDRKVGGAAAGDGKRMGLCREDGLVERAVPTL